MDSNGGALSFEAMINDTRWQSVLNGMERRMLGFTSLVTKQSELADRSLSGIGNAATGLTKVNQEAVAAGLSLQRLSQLAVGAFAFNKLAELPQELLQVRGEFQQLEIAFTTMLRSKGKAEAFLKEGAAFAATSPFNLKDVGTAQKQLLAYGFSVNEIIPSLKKLGDISAGLGLPLERLTYLYGTTKTQGRLFAQDLNQFVGSGIPLIAELAKQFGVAEDKVRGLVEDGKVGFAEVKKAIEGMTSGSGIFTGTLDAQSKSLLGLKEKLGDAYAAMLNNIGKQNEGIAADLLNTATNLVQNYQDVVDIVEVLAATYGGYRAAIILSTVAQTVAAAATDKEIAAAATRLPLLRAEVSVLSEKKAQLVQVATAQAAALKTAQAESATAQLAAANAATMLDARKRIALVQEAQVAQNNVIALQETTSVARRNAIAAASEFYAAKQAVSATATTAAGLAENRLSAAQALRLSITQALTRAQIAFNASILSNPIVLIGTAIAALTTAYFVFREEETKITTAQELMAQSSAKVSDKMAEQKSAITGLISTIKNQNVAESERKKAYDQLNQVAPEILNNLDFEKSKTADLTKELDKYLVSLRQKIRLEAGQESLKAVYMQEEAALKAREKAQENVNQLIAEANKLSNQRQGGSEQTGNAARIAYSQQIAAAKQVVEARVADEKRAGEERIKVEESYNKIVVGNNVAALKAERAKNEVILNTYDSKSLAYKQAEDSIVKIDAQIKDLTKSQQEQAKAENLTLKVIQDKIREKRKELSLTNNTAAQNAKIRQEIEDLKAQERQLTGKKTKSETDAEKVGPLGSLSYYDNVIKKTDEALSKIPKDDTKNIARLLAVKVGAEQKAAEIRTLLETPAGSIKYFEAIASAAQTALEKTPVMNTAAIARQKQIIIDAQAQAEDARKLIAVRSFDEEIVYKKSQYELYQKWVETYGKQSADVQFSDLKKSGEDFLDFLNKQIAQLENDKENVGLTDRQANSLSILRDQRQELTGQKTAIDLFKDSLQLARSSAGSLGDYLDILKQKQAELNTKPNTQEYLALRQQVATDLVDTQQQLARELNGYLQNVTGAEEQRLAVTKRYADLRLALENKYTGKVKDAAYDITKAKIDKGQKDEIKEIEEKATQASEAYKKLDEVILSSGRNAQRERLALLNKYLEAEKAAANTQVYKGRLKERNDLVTTISNEDLDRLSEYGQLVGQFGSALSTLGGDSARAGEALISLSGTIGMVAESFKKGVDKSQLYATAISGLITLFSAITDAAAKRKQAENDYYASVIAQQQQYNLLLNEQLAIRSKNSNPFIEDYTSELKDNFEAQRQAQAKLDESLKKLNEGRAKEGLKNQLDNAGALKLIGTGAGTGAAIGALISGPLAPVGAAIGAVIGGAVGALTSLFGGATKKADEFGALLERYPGLIEQSADGTKRVNLALAQTLIDTGQLDDKTKALVQTTIEWQKQVDATKQSIQDIIKNLVGQLGDGLRDAMVNAFKEGTDAAQAFSDVLSKVIEDFVTKLLYTQIFAPYFKKLGQEMTKSLDTEHGGDGNIIDDLKRFQNDTAEGQKQYLAYLQQWKDYSESMGFDKVLKSAGTSGTRNPNSTGQVIQASVTESTANVLEGQINAMRITQADTNAQIRQSLIFLSGIEKNTGRTADNTAYLEEINRSLKTLAANPTRGLGQPG